MYRQIDKSSNRQIVILGAGAIGKALAVFLVKCGRDVILLRGQVEKSMSYRETIKVELPDGEVIAAEVPVHTMDAVDQIDGTILITAKSYGNKSIAARLKNKMVSSPVVLLQNGLGVEDAFLEAGFTNVFRCVLFATSQYRPGGPLLFRPAANSPIGLVSGEEYLLPGIIEMLSNEHMPFEATGSIQPVVWMKTIINCVFNSVCPLLETDNGIFHRNPRVMELAITIVDECLQVAAASDIMPERQSLLDRLLLISRSTDGQLISTYQDILHHRETEIDTLNLAIAAKADALHLDKKAEKVRILGELVKIKAELGRSSPEF